MDSQATLAVLSELVSRARLAEQAGITFGGDRNTYQALGYKRELQAQDYRARYERGDISARIIEAYPSATWRGVGGELIEDENPDVVTGFEEAWFDLARRLNVWSVFKRADILAGLGRYAVVLIGAPGELDQEITTVTPDQIFYLQAFSEEDAEIKEFDKDATSTRFGQPTLYGLKRISPDPAIITRNVHWTRIVHVADGTLSDLVYGTPRLKRVWNRLDDLDKLVGSGSEAFWIRAHQGLQFDIDKDLKPNPEEKAAMSAEIDEYINNIRRVIRTRGVTVNPLGSDVADFATNVASVISLISSATGIPQRILMGSERGELASTQDRENWTERVQDRRDEFAGPMVVRQFVDRLINLGALPKPVEYDVRWPEVNDMTDEQRVDVAVKYASINSQAGETVVTANEIRDRALNMEPLDPSEIEDENDDEVIVEDDEPEARAASSKRKPAKLFFMLKRKQRALMAPGKRRVA